MKFVYKEQIVLLPFPQPVRVPADAKILHIAQQFPGNENTVSIWFEVDAEHVSDPSDVRQIAAFGTGFAIPDNAEYLSTHILGQGSLVLHLYQLIDPEISR